jgi:hypothetical protein
MYVRASYCLIGPKRIAAPGRAPRKPGHTVKFSSAERHESFTRHVEILYGRRNSTTRRTCQTRGLRSLNLRVHLNPNRTVTWSFSRAFRTKQTKFTSSGPINMAVPGATESSQVHELFHLEMFTVYMSLLYIYCTYEIVKFIKNLKKSLSFSSYSICI